MHIKTVIVLHAAMVLVCSIGTAVGGPLPSDPNGLGGAWQGTSLVYSGAGISPFTLTGDVEFAVYAPGQFNLSFAGADPSGGSEYIYAYEVFNLGSDANAANITALSVGFVSGAIPVASQEIGDVPLIGGVAPVAAWAPGLTAFAFSGDGSGAAKWTFNPTQIAATGNSDIIFFASPNPPTIHTSGMTGGHSSSAFTGVALPSPIPEPATVTLGLIGALGLVAARRILRKQ